VCTRVYTHPYFSNNVCIYIRIFFRGTPHVRTSVCTRMYTHSYSCHSVCACVHTFIYFLCGTPHVRTSVCTHVYTHFYMHICMRTSVYSCVRVCIYIHIFFRGTHHVRASVSARVYTHSYKYFCEKISVYGCVHTFIYIFLSCVRVFAYTRAVFYGTPHVRTSVCTRVYTHSYFWIVYARVYINSYCCSQTASCENITM